MRLILVTLVIMVGAAALTTRAEAQNYPWCAQLDQGFGVQNCGFVSFDQCMETVRGEGGFCVANNTYQAPAARPPYKMKIHRSYKAP